MGEAFRILNNQTYLFSIQTQKKKNYLTFEENKMKWKKKHRLIVMKVLSVNFFKCSNNYLS